jgi:NAD(P)-dependent dehydrogenase (short-subunit alcohol dehydrogenase family)
MTSPSKVILITDAGSEIGDTTARHLASLGYRLMLGGRCVERVAALARDIAQTGRAATYQELDAASPGSLRAFLLIAEACYGRIDALVNTAGMMGGIVAVLPVIKAHGALVIHVPTDHALLAGAVAELVSAAIGHPDDADHSAADWQWVPHHV